MALRIRFTRSNFGQALEAEINKATQPITTAAIGALDDAAKLAVRDGRAQIRSAGSFRGTWVTGLNSRVYKNRGLDAAALIYHRIAIAGIFEEGGTLRGSPLMWLPLGRRKIIARRFQGKLVSVNRPGKRPLLLGNVLGKMQPLFVGVDVARIRRRFNIAGAVKSAAAKLGEFYQKRIRGLV